MVELLLAAGILCAALYVIYRLATDPARENMGAVDMEADELTTVTAANEPSIEGAVNIELADHVAVLQATQSE